MTTRSSWLPSWFPTGTPLDEQHFRARHQVLTVILVAQLPLLLLLGVLTHQADPMLDGELGVAVLLAGVGQLGLSQGIRASAVSLGLTLTAAALVEATGGQTDMHLDFLVMLGLVALYQRWAPFLLAIAFVAAHHLTMSLLDPMSVFSSPEAQQHPLLYSLLHAGFVLAMALALAASWRFTERANAARRHSEQRFRSIFEQAPVGIGIVTADRRLVEANPAWAAMLGYVPTELVGVDLATLAHPDSVTQMSEQFAHLRDGVITGYHVERVYCHRDGSPVSVRVTVAPLAYDHIPGAVVGIVEDLREFKQLEVELRQAQKLEAVGMLAAGIAHEINTPIQFVGDNLTFLSEAFTQLTTLLSTTERLCLPVDQAATDELAAARATLDRDWLLEEVPTALTQSQTGVTRVANIVGAMRNFGHPDDQNPTPVDIDAAIRDTAAVARNEYKYVADLDLELGDVPRVMGYPSQFHQVMLNLVVNAAHAVGDVVKGTEQRGAIRVRTWADDTTVHVSVADTGCGMTAQTRARIFDPFFTTKEIGRGTGQGLTIVHTVVVDKHHGTIDVDSTTGQGSVFTLHLPRQAPGVRDTGLVTVGHDHPTG